MHQDSNGFTFLCERVDDRSGIFQTHVFDYILALSTQMTPNTLKI